MNQIIVKNNLIIIKAPFDALLTLQNKLTFKDMSYCFINGKFDKSKMINRKFLTLKNKIGFTSIGFKNIILNNLSDYELQDNRPYLHPYTYTDEEIKTNLHYLELFDYQIEAIETCLREINCIIKLPTSAGKTEIFLSLCNLMQIQTLILFDRIDLAHQTFERAKKAKLDVGIIQGNNIDENHLINMTTIQSSHKLTKNYQMVIADECHKISSKTYQKLLQKENFIYRFGFSATPFTSNEYKNALIQRNIGHIAYTLPANYLIDTGKIALPKITILKINEPDIFNMSYPNCEKIGIIENSYRNNIITELTDKLTGKTLILIKKIKHGKILNSLIPDSIFISGIHDTEKRKKEIENFDTGNNNILIASTIMDEGISINSINNLIIVGAGSSQIKTIQRIGRGLRISENKNTVNVYDFLDTFNKILHKQSLKRISFYKKEGFKDLKIL